MNEQQRQAFEEWLGLARDLFFVDAISGRLIVKKAYFESPVGKIVGSHHGEGYLKASFKGRRFLVHRMNWFLSNGTWPTEQIDHINGNRSDNRPSNLRLATNAENCRNARKPLRNKSGVKGVWFDPRRNKYQAFIRAGGKQKSLGRFDSIEEATSARIKAAEKLHGDYVNHG